MAKSNKTKVHTIKHNDSLHSQEISEQDWEDLQPRIKEKYTITKTSEVITPTEVADSSQN